MGRSAIQLKLVDCGIGDDGGNVIVDGVVRMENGEIQALILRVCARRPRRPESVSGLVGRAGIRMAVTAEEMIRIPSLGKLTVLDYGRPLFLRLFGLFSLLLGMISANDGFTEPFPAGSVSGTVPVSSLPAGAGLAHLFP